VPPFCLFKTEYLTLKGGETNMISTKKLATVGVSAALFAATAMPAFAYGGSTTNVNQTNVGGDSNSINVSSNTGGNAGSGWHSHVTTGDAATVDVVVLSSVNGNGASVTSCGCSGKKKVNVNQTNVGGDSNSINVSSNTGGNTGKHVTTGGAVTAGVTVGSLVNTNVAVVN
jgi:hypothetical protein